MRYQIRPEVRELTCFSRQRLRNHSYYSKLARGPVVSRLFPQSPHCSRELYTCWAYQRDYRRVRIALLVYQFDSLTVVPLSPSVSEMKATISLPRYYQHRLTHWSMKVVGAVGIR
jgi:hypothetical protein